MKENSTKVIQYNFLTNQPLGEDLFENKSQDKIAEVLSKKIINDPEFKIIGIDGEWGSGKSNLVSLLEKKLKGSHNFFVYDVWGHQEDEQRKSILVELTEFIKQEDGLLKKDNKKVWDNNLKILLAKSKETTTINQPYLSVGFIFSLFSIVYVPTVNVFKDSLKDFFEIESWFWKLVLVAFPICIVFGIYTWNLIKNWKNKNGFWISFRNSAEETFQVYTNKQKEETKIETISEDQPSVRDFQKWMEDINNDLEKKLIIVFDNFDRLPKKHILNIWSSIHIFFAEKKYSNIKVIIPFDREHVQNAFKDLNGIDSKFGDDYVNKTFDIVFRITLPIMSNWKKFFSEQWRKAFINTDEDELKLVIQVYEFLNRRITPREIISFINEILTIKLLDPAFKERYIAIFALKKVEILKDPLKAITNLEYLKGLKSFYENDTDFSKQITAIIYHIEVDNALELIYTQELKDALNKNNVDQFNTICQSEFIDSIFNSAITELEILENPIITLAQLEDDSKVSTLHLNQAWQIFYRKILSANSKIEKLKIEDWQLKLLKNISDNNYLSNLLQGYVKILTDENILDYVELIDNIKGEIDEQRVLNLLIEISINAESFVKLVENKGEYYSPYKLKTNENDLEKYLIEIGIQKVFDLKQTKVLAKDFDLKKYKEWLVKENISVYANSNDIQSANNTLIKIKENSKNSGDLKNTLDDYGIYYLYINNISSPLPIIDDLIAMRISMGDKFNITYASHFQDILDSENESKATKIASLILYYIDYGDLLVKSKDFSSSPLFRQMVLKLFVKSNFTKRADIAKLIENYKIIKSSLEIGDSLLLNEFNRWSVEKSKLDLNILDDEFITDCFTYAHLNISKSFIDKFNSDFKNFDEDIYKVVFSKETDIHFRYFEKLNLDYLTQASLDVFQKQFLEVLKKNTSLGKLLNILSIYDSNNATLSIINTLMNIRDEYLNSNISLSVSTGKDLLPYFLKYNLLNEKKDIFRLIIKNEFLSDNEFVKFLSNNSAEIKDLYHKATASEKEGFRNTINEKREDDESIEELAKLIDIRKKPIEKEKK
ncbi:P-loop NTPase fold protein [Flavobacterium sp. 245]|uniref:P-loop NTPase fold protein n=1 Tax=Flavobacterium sp. 245 TaxID=2512115 RepID=UPI00105BE457|nr:P-loop NTPase fold protein [Flavobacterium sp. 245]TDO96087.1 KAP-like P-loop domain-containing protein [Flavobacterium sp. 245]